MSDLYAEHYTKYFRGIINSFIDHSFKDVEIQLSSYNTCVPQKCVFQNVGKYLENCHSRLNSTNLEEPVRGKKHYLRSVGIERLVAGHI